jgi:hypothetical protein
MREGSILAPADRVLLLRLQCRALQYFLDNQTPHGLMLDRQSNHGARRPHGLCSTTATGMGFIALALASAPPYRLIDAGQAISRIGRGLRAIRDRLPHDHGVMPHFVDSSTDEVVGSDHFSTVETAWVVAGALWAAAYLHAPELVALATAIYDRVDWHYWTGPEASERGPLLRHGKDRNGSFLKSRWDRLNGETAFMYVLGAGAEGSRALPAESWSALQPFYGWTAGRRFNNADLGLFVFQYGLDLLDLKAWRAPGDVDLFAEAAIATSANRDLCRVASDRFVTYQRFWGLSSGDGPGQHAGDDVYRCYAPPGPVDGTAHITASLASIAHDPDSVLENVRQALGESDPGVFGRYGFSSLNLDRRWSSRDVIGIDLGAAIVALDNCLAENRIREVFHGLPCVQRGLKRLGFVRSDGVVRSTTGAAAAATSTGPASAA